MTRFRTLSLIAALAAAGSVSAIAVAQERSSPPRPQLPSGSYQQSCRGASMSGSMLSAQCTNRQGQPVSSRIDVNGCRGRDIRNDSGRLACATTGGGPRPPTPVIPSGSYQQSCRGASMSGSTLSAQCTNRQGRPVASRIDVNSCRGRDIRNDNGRLACASTGGPRPPTPPGGGGGVSPPTGGNYEAILYTSANFRGQSLRVSGPAANLAWWPGFNDNVRSIRIVRGRAQVCVDAQYRGQCQTLSRSAPDLNRIGMGNRISSVR